MWDLITAALLLLGLSCLAFLAGLRLAAEATPREVSDTERVCASFSLRRFLTQSLYAVILAALLLYVFRYHGTWQMARLVPFSGAIILTNWIPPAGAFLAASVLRQQATPPWRRAGLAILILLVSFYSLTCCFQGQLPLRAFDGKPARWRNQQTLPSSCGPCCAASLLRAHGIDATEQEMVQLCLTSYRGCPALGLYRGLKLKTAGTNWDVEVVTCSVERLLETQGPLLLRIQLPPMKWSSCRRTIWQRRGYEHVVLMERADGEGHVKVLDPAIPLHARADWHVEDLYEKWSGEALRLVPR